MKTRPIRTITATGDDTVDYVMVPETPFERALARHVIETSMTRKFRDVAGREWILWVGDPNAETGAFEIGYESGDPVDTLGMLTIRGEAFVVERPYPASEAFRMYVLWRFPDQPPHLPTEQSNEAPYVPVIWPPRSA